MIRMNIAKWVTAGALALAAVPAIGWAVHSNHVTAAVVPARLVSTAKPAVATRTVAPTKVVAQKKVAHHKKVSRHRKVAHARKHSVTHKHTARHHVAKKVTATVH